MVKIGQISTRVNNTHKCALAVDLTGGDTCTLHLEPGQSLKETLKAIDKFRDDFLQVQINRNLKSARDKLFNEFMQLATMSESTHGTYILQNARMLKIAKLIPDKFQQFPESIRIGTTVHLRGAPY